MRPPGQPELCPHPRLVHVVSEAPRLSLLFPARARVLPHQVTSNPVSTGLRNEWSARQPWQLPPVEDRDSPEVVLVNS